MKHYKPIKCVVCSKIFTPTAANQNTCCEAHRQQRATELRKIREKKRLTCQEKQTCGNLRDC